MKCPRCKKGQLHSFAPPEGSRDERRLRACDRCDYTDPDEDDRRVPVETLSPTMMAVRGHLRS